MRSLPLMRMTFDYKANEHKMGEHAAKTINDIARSMNPTHLNEAVPAPSLDRGALSEHAHTGGTIMGTNPRDSALNNTCRAGTATTCSCRRQRLSSQRPYNPTGPVGALGLLEGGRDQEPLRFKSPGAGAA